MSLNDRSKREAASIDDDFSTSGQPAVKIKKREPDPHSELAELRCKVTNLEQKLAKSEETCQGACRMLGEAKERIEFLENLVDSKRDVIDGVKDKGRVDELEKKVAELTNQLEEREADRVKERERRIDELMSQLAQYEGQSQPPVLLHRPTAMEHLQQQCPDAMQQLQQLPIVGSPQMIHEKGHLTNILKLCIPDSPESISLDSAIKQMEDTMRQHGRKKVYAYHRNQLKAGNYTAMYPCEVCERSPYARDVIQHFLCKKHADKVRAVGGAVSLTAFQHWFGLLQPVKSTAAARTAAPTVHPAQQPAAAAVAATW